MLLLRLPSGRTRVLHGAPDRAAVLAALQDLEGLPAPAVLHALLQDHAGRPDALGDPRNFGLPRLSGLPLLPPQGVAGRDRVRLLPTLIGASGRAQELHISDANGKVLGSGFAFSI